MKRKLLCFMALLMCFTTVGLASWDRTINFAGYNWTVKDVYMGPGPNYFSDSEEEVWVDENGYLHLEINYRDGVWNASEVVCNASIGNGKYIFVVDGRMDLLNEMVVLGMFTWDDLTRDGDWREIDIEYSRWGQVDNEPGQYVIQPPSTTGNKYRFDIVYNMGTNVTTNMFEWNSDGTVDFQTYFGDYTPDPNVENMVASFNYTGNDAPEPGWEQPRINLWLFGGNPPSDSEDVEVVIKDFKLFPHAGADDFSPPTPNPVGWSVEPYATGPGEIIMTAETATDDNRVLYNFTCTGGGGYDSGWQWTETYTDKGLDPNTTYTYTVTTRDCSANMNEGSASVAKSATTTAPLELHVHDISMGYRKGGPRIYGQATVWVKDQLDDDVEGAEVYGEWSDAVVANDEGITGVDGTVMIESPWVRDGGTFVFTVTDIVKSGCTYDPNSNVETSDSITYYR